MPYRQEFIIDPGTAVRLAKIDPAYKDHQLTRDAAQPEIARQVDRMRRLQYLLYADASRSLLIVLQGLDATGKDGTIRHLFAGMNPQGISVASFKAPDPPEIAHDFLWRVHQRTPERGEVAIFNRSHYEDVLVPRVHNLAPRPVWSQRYDMINDFERMLAANGTTILKFYLHVSRSEQLARFKERLDDPARQWKISESDYTERELWPRYVEAYEEALLRTSTTWAPWFVIPADHKWFRDLAVSEIVGDAMEDMRLQPPPPRVDLTAIRRKYHAAEREQRRSP